MGYSLSVKRTLVEPMNSVRTTGKSIHQAINETYKSTENNSAEYSPEVGTRLVVPHNTHRINETPGHKRKMLLQDTNQLFLLSASKAQAGLKYSTF